MPKNDMKAPHLHGFMPQTINCRSDSVRHLSEKYSLI